MESDEQLVVAATGGSDAAFTELVRRYQERLLRFLLTRCANRADAEDALQDTFINAYRYLDSFNPRWRFSTWIYRIGIRNAMRQGSPQTREETDSIDPNADPLKACIVDSERENLWLAAKRTLSADAFTAMWLRYVEDMSIKDVAKAVDRSASWTKVTLLRARRKLSDELTTDRTLKKREIYG